MVSFARKHAGDRIRPDDINEIQVAVEGMPDPGQVAELEEAKILTQVLAYNIYDVAAPEYGAVRNSSSGVRTQNTAAINAAAADAKANGGLLVIRGTYHIDPGVIIQCRTDGSMGHLRVSDTSSTTPAVMVGGPTSDDRFEDIDIILPSVYQDGKSGTGWSGNDIGIEIQRANQSRITIPRVRNFSRNLIISATDAGNVYNEYHLGWLENGKVNLELLCRNSSGYVNENIFYGGRFHINSGEGSSISGARHIKITHNATHPLNNNLFIKPSVEGNGPEYHIELSGAYNMILQGRFESNPSRVLLADGAESNAIMYGYSTQNVQYTVDSGASSRHTHMDRVGIKVLGGGLVTTSGGSLPGVAVLDSAQTVASDVTTAYRALILRDSTSFKRTTDAAARVKIDHTNGTIGFGNGTADPTMLVSAFSTFGIQANSPFRVGSVASLPTASSNRRGMRVRVEGGTGEADKEYICMKTASDTYIWVESATG